MKMKQSIHEKAIRLIEGGIVEVDGHCVKLVKLPEIDNPCFCCNMDCLCQSANEMCDVCEECDAITNMSCFLTLVELSDKKS